MSTVVDGNLINHSSTLA